MGQPAEPVRIGLQTHDECSSRHVVGCGQNAERNVGAGGAIAGCPDLGAATSAQKPLEMKAPGQFAARLELCDALRQAAQTVTVAPTRDPCQARR